MKQNTIYFAGGTKGPNSRGDGNGGSLPRGWYVRANGERLGPFPTKTEAKREAGPDFSVEPVLKGRTHWDAWQIHAAACAALSNLQND